MLVVYIDESYDRQGKPGYWMAAVMVHESRLRAYWKDLKEVANRLVPELPMGTELHATDLFSAKGVFSGISPQVRIDIHFAGLEVLSRHAFRVSVCGDASAGSLSVGACRLRVLEALVNRIESVGEQANEFVVLVCDEEQETAARVVSMLRGRRSGREDTAILEAAMFGRSIDSPGIWGADLVAFVERRLAMNYESDDRNDRRRRGVLRRLRSSYEGILDVGEVFVS